MNVPAGAGRLSDLLPGPAFQVDRAHEMLVAAPGARPKVRASAQHLPFADRTFAGALCHRLLHHVAGSDERVAILSELARVTRGPILASFFHRVSVQSLRRGIARRLGKRRSGRSSITLRRFVRDASRAGLVVDSVAPLLPLWSEQWLVRLGHISDW